MGVRKSTRKFEKNHLNRTLEKRKSGSKVKQLHALKEKRKKKRRAENEDGQDGDEDDKNKVQVNGGDSVGIKALEGMSVEAFLGGGFQVPEVKGKARNSRKENEEKGTGEKRKRLEEEEEKDEEDGLDSGLDDEDPDVGSSASDAEDEIASHKAAIAALEENDPEFYKYLKENDTELLEFDDLAGIDELSSGSIDSADEKPKKKRAKKQKKKGDDDDESAQEDGGSEGEGKGSHAEEVTKVHVARWKKALVEEHSLRALRTVVLAFRAAVHVNEDRVESHAFKYSITNPDVYNDLMLLGLQHIPTALNHHLPIKESASGKIRLPTDSKKFGVLTPLLKSHSSSLLTLLPNLTDPATLKLHLTSCTNLLPYFFPFRKFLKSFLKAVVDIWSTFSTYGAATNAVDDSVRITAFLVVRRAIVLGDDGIKETCFKALYAGFVKASRNTNIHTLASVNLMKNCAAETLGLQGMERVGYIVGFGYIRQLAIHLRNSITNPTKDSHKTIYNWQYIHSLDFWSRSLSALCSTSHLADPTTSPYHPLIYPLVQVTLGAARLIPTPQYFPLRFHLIRALLRVSESTGAFIPLSPLLFEVLSSSTIRKKCPPPAAGSSSKSLDLEMIIRCPQPNIKSRSYQTSVSDTTSHLLGEFLTTWCKSPAFPELASPIIVGLKRLLKRNESVNPQALSPLRVLVTKIEANATYVESERQKWAAEVEAAPSRLPQKGRGEEGSGRGVDAGFDSFLKEKEVKQMPLGAYVIAQRKAREEKRKVLEDAARQEGERRRKGRKGGESEDEECEEEATESGSDDGDAEDMEDGEDEGDSD